MRNFSRALIFFGLLSASKAHHFIRLVVLAGLGLAGLWMLHTLAQDVHKIQASGGLTGGAGGKILGDALSNIRVFEKRSIASGEEEQPLEINWEFVLSRDPARCARSFICQLAAREDQDTLDETEQNILKLTRSSAQKDSWASKQLLEALKYGENSINPNACMKMYKLCPYSSRTMATLLRLFGG